MTAEKSLKLRALPPFLLKNLPARIIAQHDAYLGKRGYLAEEIRLRGGRKTEFCFRGTSIFCEEELGSEELGEIFYKLCGASVYAHAESVCRGFIRAEDGIRIGVCGRATVRNGRVEAVYDISSLNIRLPGELHPPVGKLAESFLNSYGGMLIISPPGVGKTTVLRALIRELSGKRGKRLAVIDSAGELAHSLHGAELRADILEGYPRGVGIEIAVRTMNPQIIVCDEIGNSDDVEALLGAASCGVSIIASAHGESIEQTVGRSGIGKLHEAGLFESYVILERSPGEAFCRYILKKGRELGGGGYA